MSENLIFEALAFLNNYETSPSVSSTGNMTKIREIYIKNAIVSLLTIKKFNKETDVALLVNFELDMKWRTLLEDYDIRIVYCKYDTFRMPPDIIYSLSYYKLCAFDYIIKNTEYKKICFVDCDTFGVGNFRKIWEETEDALLMIPNDSSISAKVRKEIITMYSMINEDRNIAHISSGFISGKRETLKEVLNNCQNVYSKIISMKDISPEGGDEIIWSLALAEYSGKIYSPRAYVLLSNVGAREYWVDKQDYEDKEIVIWHLPAEKRYGLIWAFDYFEKYGGFPGKNKMAKVCRIRHVKSHFTLESLNAIFSDRTVVTRNILKLWGKLSAKPKK